MFNGSFIMSMPSTKSCNTCGDDAAMLLPMVNYSTGSGVMGRIEKLFYAEYSGANLTFHSRISPLGGVAGGWGIQG